MTFSLSTSLKTFVDELEKPRAAFAYGIDTRELRHNAFLHFMLRSPVPFDFSTLFVKELAAAAMEIDSSKRPDERRAWDSLRTQKITAISSRCNASGGRGFRPDEVIYCTMADKTTTIIVIEMKVKADDGSRQLAEYLKKDVQKKNPQDKMAGLLLCIPGKDRPDDKSFPVLTGQMYRECIKQVVNKCKSPLKDRTLWLIKDYTRTLAFLDTMDKTILSCGDKLRELKEWMHKKTKEDRHAAIAESPELELLWPWLEDNDRWVMERIMREVAALTNKALSESRRSLNLQWHGSAMSSKDGAYVDFYPQNDRLTIGNESDGAYLFACWRLGSGFEVRAIVKNYNGTPTHESKDRMSKLAERARAAIEPIWKSEDTKFAGRTKDKKSCMVGRLENPTYSVDRIVEKALKEIERIEPALTSVVQDLRSA